MSPHAELPPLHVTTQVLESHVMSPHAVPAVHWMSHVFASVQSISPHAPGLAQPIVQFQPVGQLIAPLPAPTIVHVLVPKSHEAHVGGHTAASGGPASG
jgi:hypothetical protein